MPNHRFYADSTSLIGLARIGRLDLLQLLYPPVYVTAMVWTEVTRDPSKSGTQRLVDALAAGVLLIVDEGDASAYPSLDPGEFTVISAAAAAGAAVITDDRKARTLIEEDPTLQASIPVLTGVIGLLVLAKRRGSIASIRPLLDQLIGETFRISPSLYRDALRAAGEL